MNFSIITCTYNPNNSTFSRLIKAIKKLLLPSNSSIEWIIVDNNSTPPIKDKYIGLKEISFAKIIKEKKAGLTFARKTGIDAAKGDWIIFFDDDNEPYQSYLNGLEELIKQYPDVVCWGSGDISVEYLLKKTTKTLSKHKHIFQERLLDKDLIFADINWGRYYPVGTGMCIKKEHAITYLKKIDKGEYTATDRKGTSLISGGDTQLGLHLLNQDLKIGSSPLLRLNHLIEKRKANLKYLMRQQYWTASSFVFVYNQVVEPKLTIELLSQKEIIKKGIKQFYFFIKVKKMYVVEALVALSAFLGNINARYIAANKKNPLILRLIEKLIS